MVAVLVIVFPFVRKCDFEVLLFEMGRFEDATNNAAHDDVRNLLYKLGTARAQADMWKQRPQSQIDDVFVILRSVLFFLGGACERQKKVTMTLLKNKSSDRVSASDRGIIGSLMTETDPGTRMAEAQAAAEQVAQLARQYVLDRSCCIM